MIGVAALAILAGAGLLAVDLTPGIPRRAHDVVSALPLLLIALAFLAHQARSRATPAQFLKAALLCLAFLLWALSQLLPDVPHSVLFNDAAIVLFSLDVALVVWSGVERRGHTL